MDFICDPVGASSYARNSLLIAQRLPRNYSETTTVLTYSNAANHACRLDALLRWKSGISCGDTALGHAAFMKRRDACRPLPSRGVVVVLNRYVKSSGQAGSVAFQ